MYHVKELVQCQDAHDPRQQGATPLIGNDCWICGEYVANLFKN